MKQIKKIGIMGGTFNPIHTGHLLLAEEARQFFCLDEVLFMPSGNSYMKDSSLIPSGQIRAEMTRLAIQTNPFFSLSLAEVEREGATYTYETLRQLHRENPDSEYYFMIGADNLFSIEHWKKPEEIMENCILIAADRGEKTEEELQEKVKELKERFHADIRLLPLRKMDISSTEIRARIERGESVRYMVPDEVISYIKEQGLYRK